MTKLSNGIEYQNIFLPAAYAEYLIRNGFSAIVIPGGTTIQFQKDSICLYVKNDTLDVFRERSGNWVIYQSFTGISELDEIGWIMLLQVMKAQRANHRSPLIPH